MNYKEASEFIGKPGGTLRYASLSEAAVVLNDRVVELEAQRDDLVKAMEEISKGEGAFDMDPLEHAANCINNMKGIAKHVLKAIAEIENGRNNS